MERPQSEKIEANPKTEPDVVNQAVRGGGCGGGLEQGM